MTKLTIPEWQYIVNALAKRPFEEVADIIPKVMALANELQKPSAEVIDIADRTDKAS